MNIYVNGTRVPALLIEALFIIEVTIKGKEKILLEPNSNNFYSQDSARNVKVIRLNFKDK